MKCLAIGAVAVLWAWQPAGFAQQAEDDLPVIQSRPVGGAPEPAKEEEPTAGPVRGQGMLLGIHGAPVESKRRAAKTAGLAVETGLRTVKVLPDGIRWGEMQTSARRRIEFGALDGVVSAYQEAGFTQVMIPLQSHSAWASKDFGRGGGRNPAPRDEYLDLYAAWVRAVVERYDGDGVADMPGLRYAVRWYEIGGAFGAEEPEPVAEYLVMLERAHAAAKLASERVIIAPAGILTTGVFRDGSAPADPEGAFAAASRLVGRSLAEVRALLDAGHAYDVVNLYAHGDPSEFAAALTWLQGEMQARGVAKPVIVGSVLVTPFVAGGPATSCTLDPEVMGVILPPAREEDRCRLASYFQRLVRKDDYTRLWVQRFASADLVKKVLLAAEHGVVLINASLTEDLSPLQDAGFAGAAGNAPWGGMLDSRGGQLRPSFFALRQLNQHMHGFTGVRRMPTADDAIRVYRIQRPRGNLWIAWVEPDTLMLPEDNVVAREIDLPVQAANVLLERMITQPGLLRSRPQLLITTAGTVTVTVGQQPVFVFPAY
jgi:hypothetical protein